MNHHSIFSAAPRLTAVILSAAIILLAGLSLPACNEPESVSTSDAPTIEIAADELTVGEGESLALEVTSSADLLQWSSSDEQTVSCVNGTITAHQAGNAVVTVSDGSNSDTVNVTVAENAVSDAQALITKLAVFGAPLDELRTMQSRLNNCTGRHIDDVQKVIDILSDCTSNGVEQTKLSEAAEGAEIDELTVLEAASYCWAAGQAEQHDAVISFTGDVTIGMQNEQKGIYFFPEVYSKQNSITYPFDRVKRFFLNDDLTVINFEGVLTEYERFVRKAFFFRGKPEYADMLPASGIDAATLANNHSMDYYQQGYDDTQKYLTDAGITTFDQGRPAEYTITTSDGSTINVALFAFNLIGNTRFQPEKEALSLMAEYKKDPDTIVIASVHWGIEYMEEPNNDQYNFGRALVDGGADIVIGHHPHIVQGIEYYNDRYIAYSLGNFSFAGNTIAQQPHSMILQANIDRIGGKAVVSGISVIPCYITSSGDFINNYQPCVQYGQKAQSIMDILARRSSLTKHGAEELIWSGI